MIMVAVYRTKIIVSLGPSPANPETVRKLMELDVSGFKIGFTHGSRGSLAWVC